ncbi:TolC family protein [Leptospira bandrabouensis]|uniref:TolC family protein n=1 Tax=Leptospira bandrabouensis TaxID=2484903 RepID=UPI001EE890E3|nr:TolC family protein [Leptospira bandrabouensis]MCG6144404.1 TolC family protein [Leptospira bandrabouensis]MCG6160065.1 TolC family protein [Leptospira bandrabouensis]MCG6163998.1 TolC family protein [Leptospira bandrabouensis]MCW7456893.1 TolC family protein [Leptospira bandrabouensis]MCW7475839.1 TolC family protein [Leptospira bandrabouensis]
MKLIRFTFVIFAIFGLVTLSAKPVQVKDLWQTALQSNPEFLSAKADYDKAFFENEKSYASYLPTVNVLASARQSSANFSGSGTVNDPLINGSSGTGTSTNQQTSSGESRPTAINRYSVGLSTNQNLFAGFKDKSGIEKTEALLQAAKQTLNDSRLKICFELKSGYAQMLYAKELHQLSEKIKERRTKNRDLVKLRYEVGREHKGSFLLSESFVKQSEFEVSSAFRLFESNVNEVERVISNRMDVSINSEFVYEPILEKKFSEKEKENLLESHPSVMAEQSKVRAAQANIGVAEAGFYPDLNLSATVTRQDDVWLPKPRNYSFGLNLTYPLFNGGRDYYNVKIAKTEYEKSIHTRDAKKNSLLFSLEQSHLNFKNASEQMVVLTEFYKASEIRAMIARSQYSNGLISFENWDIIENDLINREKNLLIGKRDLGLAEATYLRNLGKCFDED